MRTIRQPVGVLALLAALAAGSAQAQQTSLLSTDYANGGFIAVGNTGWSFEVSSCLVSTSACTDTDVTASVSGGALSLVYTNVGGGSLLNSTGTYPNYNGATYSDLNVTVIVKSPGGNIVSGSDSMAGATFTGNGNVSVGETVTDSAASSTINLTLGLNSGSSLLTTSAIFAPVNTVTASTDANAQVAFGPGSASITSVTQTFTTVPEPFSASLLAVGVAGIGLVRRKVRVSK